MIENVFSARTIDCYGHMERSAAISQCPEGTYHVHSDYGTVEFIEPDLELNVPENMASARTSGGLSVKEIVGTSLHNYAMPLIRYKTGDYALVEQKPGNCRCKRNFPEIVSLIVVVTPGGKMVTALYVALNRTPGVLWGQFIQKDINNLTVKVDYKTAAHPGGDAALMENIRALVGKEINIEILHEKFNQAKADRGRKSKVVVSNIARFTRENTGTRRIHRDR